MSSPQFLDLHKWANLALEAIDDKRDAPLTLVKQLAEGTQTCLAYLDLTDAITPADSKIVRVPRKLFEEVCAFVGMEALILRMNRPSHASPQVAYRYDQCERVAAQLSDIMDVLGLVPQRENENEEEEVS